MSNEYKLYDFKIARMKPPSIHDLTSGQYWTENGHGIEPFLTSDLKHDIVLVLESEHPNSSTVTELWNRLFDQVVKKSNIELPVHGDLIKGNILIQCASIKQVKRNKDKLNELVRQANALYHTYAERLNDLQTEAEQMTFAEDGDAEG